MKQNKGIIGIGLIVAIVLGIVVVGGGAYYLGNGGYLRETRNQENILPNNENQKIPTIEDKQVSNNLNTTSSIKVLTPNGGEKFGPDQKAEVKWTSVRGDTVDVYLKHSDGSLCLVKTLPSSSSSWNFTPYNYKCLVTGKIISAGDYKVSVYLYKDKEMRPEPGTAFGGNDNSYVMDSSDSDFIIAPACEGMGCGNNSDFKNPPISTTLPEHIGTGAGCGFTKCWPPVITTSSKSYSCNNIGIAPNTEGNDVTKQKVFNGKTYCIHSLSDGYAGGRGYTYTYTTSDGNGTKIASFVLTYQSCGVYGGPNEPQVIQCSTNQNNFSNNLDSIVDNFFKINSPTTSVGAADNNLVKLTSCGVSFSKASNWSVVSSTGNEVVLDILSTDHIVGTSGINVKCVLGNSITDTDAKFGNITYFYESSSQKWMVSKPNERDGGTFPAVVATPEFTVNGFPVFKGTGRWLTYIVPISPNSILSLKEGDTEGGYTQTLTNLVKTIKKL